MEPTDELAARNRVVENRRIAVCQTEIRLSDDSSSRLNLSVSFTSTFERIGWCWPRERCFGPSPVIFRRFLHVFADELMAERNVWRGSDTLSNPPRKSFLPESGLARCVTHDASLASGRRSLATAPDQPHHLSVVGAFDQASPVLGIRSIGPRARRTTISGSSRPASLRQRPPSGVRAAPVDSA